MFSKLVYTKSLKFNFVLPSEAGQTSVCCIIEGVLFHIVFRVDPFLFEFPPNRFRDIQMWRIWRQESYKQSSILPKWNSLLDNFRSMHTGIIQYKNCFFLNLEREFFQILQHKLCPYVLLCHSPKVFAFSIDEAQTINTISPLRRNRDLFPGKLPSIRNISLATNMRLVTIIKVNMALFTQLFQICKQCYLMVVIIGIWFSFGAKPYPFISSTKTFKKRRSVLLLTDFPLSVSHSALAVCKRCRWILPKLIKNPCQHR